MRALLLRWKKARFAKRTQKAIAAAGGATDFVYDAATFTLKRPNNVAFLTNVYQACDQAKGADAERIFNNFIAAFVATGSQTDPVYEEAEDKLTAVVREHALLAINDGPGWGMDKATSPTARPARAPLSTWFAKAVVIDYPTHVAVVHESLLHQWNITFDEAFARGLEKLKACTVAKFRQEDGYYVGEWNDDYDSSRILVPTVFEDLALNGFPVVALPNRLTLMVAGSNDHNAIRAMLTKAEKIVTQLPKPQNPAPLMIRDGVVTDFEVEPSSPIFNEVQRAKKIAALSTYLGQKNNLEHHFKQTGKDIFVASFTLHQTPEGSYISSSVWTKNVPTLLPETDQVFFVDSDLPEDKRRVAIAPWAKVVAVLGELMLDTNMFPRRHYVSKFPAEEQLRSLRETN